MIWYQNSKFIHSDTKEPYTNLQSFPLQDSSYQSILAEARISNEERNTVSQYYIINRMLYSRQKVQFYSTFPSVDSVINSFEDNLCEDYLRLIQYTLNEGPLSWPKQFVEKGGHTKVVDLLNQLLTENKNHYISIIDKNYKLISASLSIILTLFAYDDSLETIILKQFHQKSAFSFFLNLLHPVDHFLDERIVMLLNSVYEKPNHSTVRFDSVKDFAKKEKKDHYNDIFELLIHLSYKDKSRFSSSFVNLIYQILIFLSSSPKHIHLLYYFCHRLYFANFEDFISAFEGVSDRQFEALFYVISTTLNNIKSQYIGMIGTFASDPFNLGSLVHGLLSQEEFDNFNVYREQLNGLFYGIAKNSINNVNILTDWSSSHHLLHEKENDTNDLLLFNPAKTNYGYEIIHRLLLELCYIIGNQDKMPVELQEKASFDYILAIMKMSRFLYMCNPYMEITEIIRRSSSLIESIQKHMKKSENLPITFLFEIEPPSIIAKEWQNKSNFFAGDDFFSCFLLQLLMLMTNSFHLFHTEEDPMDAMTCQTLTMIFRGASLRLGQKETFNYYFSLMAKTAGFDKFAEECLQVHYDEQNDAGFNAQLISFGDMVISLQQLPHMDEISKIQDQDEEDTKVEEESPKEEEQKAQEEPPKEEEPQSEIVYDNDLLPPPPPPPSLAPPPPPPPPPGMNAAQPAFSVRLRPIFMKSLKPIDKTIWANINSSDAELDLELLVSMFRQKGQPVKKVVEGGDAKSPALVKKVEIQILSDDKVKNLAIFFKSMKCGPEMIIGTIRNLDLSISEEFLGKIIQTLPTEEEARTLSFFKGDISKLTIADRYVYLISQFPYNLFVSSINLLALQSLGRRDIDDNIAKLKKVSGALQQILHSNSLIYILKLVKKIRNYINEGNRYVSEGITLTVLDSLKDYRSPKHQGETMLSYLIAFLMDKNPDALNVVEELSLIPSANQVDFESIRKELNPIKTQMDAIMALKKTATPIFVQRVTELENDVGSTLTSAISMVARCDTLSKEVMHGFGEDENLTYKDFFQSLTSFLDSFQTLRKEIREKREKEQREKTRRNPVRLNNNLGNTQRGVHNAIMSKVQSGAIKRVE